MLLTDLDNNIQKNCLAHTLLSSFLIVALFAGLQKCEQLNKNESLFLFHNEQSKQTYLSSHHRNSGALIYQNVLSENKALL